MGPERDSPAPAYVTLLAGSAAWSASPAPKSGASDPNFRYGHQDELEFWMQGHSVKDIAKRLKRSERTVHDWLHGKRKVPWWVPEILRLQHYEYQDRLRQMGFEPLKTRLAIATVVILTFPTPASPANAPITPLQKTIESNQTSAR